MAVKLAWLVMLLAGLSSLGLFVSLYSLTTTNPVSPQNLGVLHAFARPTHVNPPTTTMFDTPPDWLPHTPLTEHLQRVQHPLNCSSRKFLVYTMPKINGSDTRNLGAMLTSLWRWVVLALEDDRTVVIDSTHWNMADCPHNEAKEGRSSGYARARPFQRNFLRAPRVSQASSGQSWALFSYLYKEGPLGFR